VAVAGLNTPLLVYVTRKTAHGETGSFELSAWMPLLVLAIAWLNAVTWGLLGLVAATRYIF
jgi:hypothetical protein